MRVQLPEESSSTVMISEPLAAAAGPMRKANCTESFSQRSEFRRVASPPSSEKFSGGSPQASVRASYGALVTSPNPAGSNPCAPQLAGV